MKLLLEKEARDKDGVYMIHNPETGYAYFGSGRLGRRYSQHRNRLKTGTHSNRAFREAYAENPNFEFVGVVLEGGREELVRVEGELLQQHWGDPKLLNKIRITDGSRTGVPHTEESREKISKSKKDAWSDPEWRAMAMEAAAEGRLNMTPEEKEAAAFNRSNSLKRSYAEGKRRSMAGDVRSDEFKQNDSQNITKLWQDPTYRANQLAGRANSPNYDRQAVVAGDVHYRSIAEAARATGFSNATVINRSKSDKFPDWYYLPRNKPTDE